HLEGARAVWLSPAETLARVPLAALPGKEPGTYLLEEVALAVVPVPVLLARGKVDWATGRNQLLCVNQVDYSGPAGGASAPGRLAIRGRQPPRFSALPCGSNNLGTPLHAFRCALIGGSALGWQRWKVAHLPEEWNFMCSLSGERATEEAL